MGSQGAEGGDDDDDDDDAEPHAATTVGPSAGEANKKKKRKRPKKKKPSALKQSSPPRVPLDDIFPSGNYPTGELWDYETTSTARAPELRYNSRGALEGDEFLKDYRKAAEVHRQTRKWVQETVKPGQTLTEIAIGIEDSVRALLGNDGLDPGTSLQSGLGFPTGLSVNNCVAHYTPNPGQKDIVLQHEDVVKVDFGVQINGWIVDSAFTMSFDPTYDNLLAAVKDATNTGIKVRKTHFTQILEQKKPTMFFPECRNRRTHQRRQRRHPRSHGKLRSRDPWQNVPRQSGAQPLRPRHQTLPYSWGEDYPFYQEFYPDQDGGG